MPHLLTLLSAFALCALFAVLNTLGGETPILPFSSFLVGATISLVLLALPLGLAMGSARDRALLAQGLRAPGGSPLRLLPTFILILFAVFSLEAVAHAPVDQALVQQIAIFSPLEKVVLIPFLCLLTPLIEECLFRGVLLHAAPPAVGLPLSALAFALAHGLNAHAPALLLFGLALGYLTLRTRSLRPALLLHAAFNLVNLLLI